MPSDSSNARSPSLSVQYLGQRSCTPLSLILVAVIEQDMRGRGLVGNLLHASADLAQLGIVVIVVEALR